MRNMNYDARRTPQAKRPLLTRQELDDIVRRLLMFLTLTGLLTVCALLVKLALSQGGVL